MSTHTPPAPRGGAWLIEAADVAATFTPEQFSDEQRMIAHTAEEFLAGEVLPNVERLEQKDWALARELVQRCGELGLLGVDVPEEYGGVGLDKVSALLVSERVSWSASFGTTFGAQANLSVLPILFFGNEDQKRRYLPRLVSGELIGAYALSESGAGSDALSAKTRATRQPDGSFLLSGEKMWISNGGFADLIVVFAKVDGEHFSSFIVERAFPGVSSGREEHKMGLHGSSTTPIILDEARVPAANLLGEIGKGHKVAFNVLNFGRFKLGAMCVGGAKCALGEAARYAATRRQFGQPIACFGAIRHKLGEMVARIYAVESLMYRTAALLDARIERAGGPATDAGPVLAAGEEFAVEASIAKVAGSEMADFVIDEEVQIHGGNGFVRDYPAEGHYRDARVNRIFEGTNEINRLLIPSMLVRRALKGDLALIPAARRLQDEVLSVDGRGVRSSSDQPMGTERDAVQACKRIGLMILGTAMERYRDHLTDEQEVLCLAADILIDAYSAESSVVRAAWAAEHGVATAPLHKDAAAIVASDAASRCEMTARQALAAMLEGDALRTALGALKRIARLQPANTVQPRRRLAEAAVARGGYLF